MEAFFLVVTIMNSVLVTLSVSLLATSQSFTYLNSELSFNSRLVRFSAAQVRLVSSAYCDGVENFRKLGKSLMKTRNNRGPSIDP